MDSGTTKTNKQKDEIKETEEEEVGTAEQMQADAENQKNLLQELTAARKQYNDNYVSPEEEKGEDAEGTFDEKVAVQKSILKRNTDYAYELTENEKKLLADREIRISKNKANVQEKKKKRAEAAKKIINYWNNAGLKEQEERKRWNEAGRANAQKNRDYFNRRIREVLAHPEETEFKARKYVKAGKEFVGVYGPVVTMTRKDYLDHCKAEADRWNKHYKNLDWGAEDADAKIKNLKSEKKKAIEEPAQKEVKDTPDSTPSGGNDTPDSTKSENSAPTGTGAGAGAGTGTGDGAPAYTEGKPFEKDGVMVTPLLDKNGNQVGYKFKDKEGKDQVLMNEDIKKTKVNLDDIKEALDKGDIKKALELLLQALLGKQQLDMQKAQTENTADGNAGAGAGTTGGTPTPEITSKDYIDNRTGVKFTVTKQGVNIQSISQTAQSNIEVFSAEHFAKAGIEPKEVEKYLEKSDFAKADELLAKVAAANGKLAARVDVKGNDIVLMDCYGKAFTLNKTKLEEFGMSGKKAEGTLKRLRASIETSKKLQKGDANMALAQVVAGYLPKEKPVVPTLPSNGWTYKKATTRMIDGKEASITINNASGKKIKLTASDFAEAYGCSKEEGREILQTYARSLRKGNTNLNAELKFVAENFDEKKHKQRATMRTVRDVLLGIGGAALTAWGVTSLAKGDGSSDGGSSDSTETNSTEILTATKTTNSNGVTPATPATPNTNRPWLDRER